MTSAIRVPVCLLVLVVVALSLVEASVRYPSRTGHTAFIPPVTSTGARGGLHQQQEAPIKTLSISRGGKNRGVKGVSAPLRAAAKAGGAKKAKKSTKKAASTQESCKKSEVIAAVAEKTGFTKADSERALQAVLDTLTEQLTLGKKISFLGFGSFQAKERAARKGRNPQTGEEIDIAAAKAPTFTASKILKDVVNGRE